MKAERDSHLEYGGHRPPDGGHGGPDRATRRQSRPAGSVRPDRGEDADEDCEEVACDGDGEAGEALQAIGFERMACGIDLVQALVHICSMTNVTIHQAKTHLSRLIDRALSGEAVVVMRGREPVIALKPVQTPKPKRRLGGLRGMIKRMADDFDEPLSDFKEYTT